MEVGKALREIRKNRNAEIYFQQIMAGLKKQPCRRLQVRALLAKSRTEWRRERAARFAEMAAEILRLSINKPKMARIVYRYVLSIADDPLPSLMAMFEIAEFENRYFEAHELAQRIYQIGSKEQCKAVRDGLKKMMLADSQKDVLWQKKGKLGIN